MEEGRDRVDEGRWFMYWMVGEKIVYRAWVVVRGCLELKVSFRDGS